MRLVALRTLVGDALHGRHDRAIERAGVGPVDLDEVARGVAQVHLHGAVDEHAHVGRPRVAVEQPALERDRVGGLEVVDVEADVVELGRRRVAVEEVQLLVAHLEPHDRVLEVGRRHAPHAEDVDVEARRLLEVVGVDAHVGEAGRAHGSTLTHPALALQRQRRADDDRRRRGRRAAAAPIAIAGQPR